MEFENVNKNQFIFKGKSQLNNNYNYNLLSYNSIYICPYIINSLAKFPFLQFLLTKIFYNLEFIQISIFENKNPEDFIQYSKTFLFNLLSSYDKRNYLSYINFIGFYEYNNNLFLFFDLTNCNLQLNDVYLSSSLWFTLIDEIVNHKHLCNIPIHTSVSQFFIKNDSFCFLLDNVDESYEIPIIGFIHKEEKKLNFTYLFGESRSNVNDIFGPFYYFTNFYEAFKNSYNSEKKEGMKNGIVRFALFTSKTKYIENHPNDIIDDSQIKLDRLKNTNTEYNNEILTIRITDYDGKWSKNNYDSVYLGNIELDNGTFMDKPMIVLKEYEQQQPLSYHYIDKKSYKEKNKFVIS